MFGKSDQEIARRYHVTLNTIMQELEVGGIVSTSQRIKLAKSYIEKIIKNMSPLSIPTKNKYRNKLMSKRDEFLSSLSKKNKEMALRLEKEYSFKVRLYNKIINNKKWRRLYSIYP